MLLELVPTLGLTKSLLHGKVHTNQQRYEQVHPTGNATEEQLIVYAEAPVGRLEDATKNTFHHQS